MPIVQISRIQHRRGLATDLPQLAAGELGWVIDEQRLYIGNGSVADGAPAVGNTEVLTANSTSFSDAVAYVYRGYLGTVTPIVTGANVDVTRTLQERLDDYVSVKAFGAKGDGSTDDTAAIQRALDELYCDIDKSDTRSRRQLLFPAGQYNTNKAIYIPPYAQLIGEGIDKTVIYQVGGGSADGRVIRFSDNGKHQRGDIGNDGATLPTNINIEGMTFKNGEAYAGVEVEKATDVRFVNCKFQGTYAQSTDNSDNDNANSKGVTVISTSALTTTNIIFDSCHFTKFARLADLSYDCENIKFINCNFSVAFYGILIGETTDGSTNGLVNGPVDVKILNSNFSSIMTNGIKAENNGSISNVVSFNNYFAKTVGTHNEGVDSVRIYPVIQFDADNCASELDYFAIDGQRDITMTPQSALQGVGVITDKVKQITLTNNQSSATATGIQLPALENKFLRVEYKMSRGTTYRVGVFTVNVIGSFVSYNDDFEENNGTAGVTLSATADNLDSTAGNETVQIKYITTNTGDDVSMDYRIITMV